MTIKNFPIILFTFLVLIFVWFYNNYQLTNFKGGLSVFFLDVGQGDATLIRTPNQNDVLIDGGPDNN